MDGGVSAVGSIFNASWRIATVVYELKAVGEQTRDLLDTTSQVSSTLQHAQVLRRQRSGLLNGIEKKWIDDVLQASDKAVGNVAALIEPARVDMQTQCNRIRLVTRGQFVLRDSPKVVVQLSRLTIAHQGLNSAMVVLCNRDGSISSPGDGGGLRKVDGGASDNDLKLPPSYETVELLDRRRESIIKRRASRLPMAVNLDDGLDRLKPLEEDPNCLPMVNVAEVQPTPITPPEPNQFAESGGLQAVEDIQISHRRPPPTPDLPPTGPCRTCAWSDTTPADHCSPSRPPSLPTMGSNRTYIPYRPPGSSDPPPQQHHTLQPPASSPQYCPYLARSPSSTILDPPSHRPPHPPSPYQPCSNISPSVAMAPPKQPPVSYSHTFPDYDCNPVPLAQSVPASDLNVHSYSHSLDGTSLDPYSRPPSCSSIWTRESSSAAPRQKGRARGRAWLEHQLDK